MTGVDHRAAMDRHDLPARNGRRLGLTHQRARPSLTSSASGSVRPDHRGIRRWPDMDGSKRCTATASAPASAAACGHETVGQNPPGPPTAATRPAWRTAGSPHPPTPEEGRGDWPASGPDARWTSKFRVTGMTGLGSRAIGHAEHPDMRRSSSSYAGRIAVHNEPLFAVAVKDYEASLLSRAFPGFLRSCCRTGGCGSVRGP
jgi:hypothetical protein